MNVIDVSVEPGAMLLMGSGAKIIVEPEGSLNMEGTQAKPITIKGEVESPGCWEMISFDNSNNSQNKLNYVNISHGGDFGKANVWCGGSTPIEIANSSFNYSANYGIYLARNVSFTDGGGNTFTGNDADDIYVHP